MRMIDADVFIKKMTGVYEEYLYDVLDDTPTIDAVPVVRCEDCKHSVRKQIGYGCEMNYRLATNGNFYCADGERKKDDVQSI